MSADAKPAATKATGTMKETERIEAPIGGPGRGPHGGGMVGQKAMTFGPSARRLVAQMSPERGKAIAVVVLAVVRVAVDPSELDVALAPAIEQPEELRCRRAGDRRGQRLGGDAGDHSAPRLRTERRTVRTEWRTVRTILRVTRSVSGWPPATLAFRV